MYSLFELLLLVFWSIGCDDNKNRIIIEHPLQTVTGMVFDSLTNQPIEGSWVGLDSIYNFGDASTDSLGNYLYNFIGPSGDTPIYCGAEGYFTQTKHTNVESPDTANLDFRLMPK